MSELKFLGRPTLRVDALEKVLGTGRYTHDLKIPGMLVAKVLRSPVPHAEIVKLDVTPALQVPGVVAAITSEDFVDHSNWGFPVKDDYMLAYK
ncbi:MAG: xanthine dehydrogenase family protein molybdopterin-binding subunit, partial [Anaerolineae bacterium]